MRPFNAFMVEISSFFAGLFAAFTITCGSPIRVTVVFLIGLVFITWCCWERE